MFFVNLIHIPAGARTKLLAKILRKIIVKMSDRCCEMTFSKGGGAAKRDLSHAFNILSK